MDKNNLLGMNSNVKLKQVTKNDALFLYELLKNKDPNANISHKKMPSYDEHVKFVMSKPYTNWYIIEYDKKNVGSIYLSKQDEIGISINNDYEYAQIVKSALRLLMKLNQRKRYLANVGPKDVKSQEFLLKNGFTRLEYVYEIKK
jgi:RimJ/RimL family protein N-acetyltransferase